jgi:transcriptional regulator with XRE-family HTH domain
LANRESLLKGIGKRIRSYREQSGLSQAELARAARLSKAYLSELESEVGRRPSADVVLRIADALGVTIAELVGRPVRPEDPREIPESLREFTKERGLSEAEIRMLAGIRLREGTPRTKERWEFIYNAIKGSRHLDEK